jgi:hypothetical protein
VQLVKCSFTSVKSLDIQKVLENGKINLKLVALQYLIDCEGINPLVLSSCIDLLLNEGPLVVFDGAAKVIIHHSKSLQPTRKQLIKFSRSRSIMTI